jgi:hypothetical protein
MNVAFWPSKGNGIHCVSNHVKKVVVHNFHGKRSEFMFLRFAWGKAKLLEEMIITLSTHALERKEDMKSEFSKLGASDRASEKQYLQILEFDIPLMFHMASDLSVRDPFFSIDLYKLSSHNDQKEEAGKMTPVMESSHNDQEEEAEKMTPVMESSHNDQVKKPLRG